MDRIRIVVAALFTSNLVKAAPVVVAAKHLRKMGSNMRALIVNSGNANCDVLTAFVPAIACCALA